MANRHRETAEIDSSHPALAGHFPGNPIVPGALILSYVEDALARATRLSPTEVVVARFHAPLKPGQPFTIELGETEGDAVRFRVVTGSTLIASGQFRSGASAQSSAASGEI